MSVSIVVVVCVIRRVEKTQHSPYLVDTQTLHHSLLLLWLASNFVACSPSHLDALTRTSLHTLHLDTLVDAILLTRLQFTARLRLELETVTLRIC